MFRPQLPAATHFYLLISTRFVLPICSQQAGECAIDAHGKNHLISSTKNTNMAMVVTITKNTPSTTATHPFILGNPSLGTSLRMMTNTPERENKNRLNNIHRSPKVDSLDKFPPLTSIFRTINKPAIKAGKNTGIVLNLDTLLRSVSLFLGLISFIAQPCCEKILEPHLLL